jgi:aspartyl-tRNA(Asn)/glutamyl-tRNA(Gln) amidotransferase subunit A
MPLAEKSGYITRAITHVDRVSLRPEYLRERPEGYHYNTKVHFTTANLIPAQVYYKAQKLRTMIREQVLGLLEEVDVLIQPTSGAPANVINLDQKVDSQEHARKALSAGGFRGPYSLSGAPALSILCGFTSATDGPNGNGGLPLAMQIAGRPFDEATVLRVAYAYEQAAGFNKRIPPEAV